MGWGDGVPESMNDKEDSLCGRESKNRSKKRKKATVDF